MTARLLDKRVNGKWPFTYTPAARTNVAATFRRVREQQQKPQTVVMLRKVAR